MIPEIEDKRSTVVSALRRNLHLALRRRTWRFKRNARLNELLPQEPVLRSHTVWGSMLPLVLALLLFRV
jgi:hypothetical protein